MMRCGHHQPRAQFLEIDQTKKDKAFIATMRTVAAIMNDLKSCLTGMTDGCIEKKVAHKLIGAIS